MLRAWLRRYLDVLLAALFMTAALLQVVFDGSMSVAAKLASGTVVVAVAVAVSQRRRAPLVLSGILLASLLLRAWIPPGEDGTAYGIAAIVAAYTNAAYLDGWQLRAGAVISAASGVYLMVTNNGSIDLGTVFFFALLFGAPWIAGRAMKLSRQRQSLLEDQAVILEEQRDERARGAVIEERQRIARELHDVVAHAISVVVLQARGGRRVLDSDPAAARQAFDTIERTSTQALAEMRRLLGLLRADDDSSLLPQPTLERLDTLADELRASGLPVEISVEGAHGSLPPGVDVSAYRIVQEALTNALKHAGPARARVRVVYDPDSVLVEVIDDGAGADGAPAGPLVDGSGHGLIGIRERVAIVGGELAAGPRPTGGYAVSARLPYAVER
jgi:signal transduction histidine kinase